MEVGLLLDDPNNLLEKLDINPGSTETQRKLQQRLASNNCWEGISLLVLGVHAGPSCTLDAACSPVNNLSVGNLLKNISITELKRFGVDLAVCLLKSGASCEDIEQRMEEPVIHVGLKVALDTGMSKSVSVIYKELYFTNTTITYSLRREEPFFSKSRFTWNKVAQIQP